MKEINEVWMEIVLESNAVTEKTDMHIRSHSFFAFNFTRRRELETGMLPSEPWSALVKFVIALSGLCDNTSVVLMCAIKCS